MRVSKSLVGAPTSNVVPFRIATGDRADRRQLLRLDEVRYPQISGGLLPFEVDVESLRRELLAPSEPRRPVRSATRTSFGCPATIAEKPVTPFRTTLYSNIRPSRETQGPVDCPRRAPKESCIFGCGLRLYRRRPLNRGCAPDAHDYVECLRNSGDRSALQGVIAVGIGNWLASPTRSPHGADVAAHATTSVCLPPAGRGDLDARS